MVDQKNFLSHYAGKKVFITGHTGFKGSWLSYLLYSVGAEVKGYALKPEERGLFQSLKLDELITHQEADIRDKKTLKQSLEEFQPDHVFHLAAQPLVRLSYQDPVTTFETNIMGAVNLLESAREMQNLRSLVFITSDKCYENKEWIWGYREQDELGGRDPYSASKAGAEVIFSSYWRSFLQHNPNLGAASARAGNVIGGGDWSVDRIIPDCIKAIENDQAIKIRSPRATRPWQHVLEPLSGYLLLGAQLFHEPKKFSSAWNFGPSASEIRTVKDVAEYMVNHFQRGSVVVDTDENQPHEAQLLQLNCDKAHQLLSWKPRWNVEETLRYTADWYLKTSQGEDPRELTKSQIHQYFQELL